MADLGQLIMSRRSIRRFRDEPVPDEIVGRLIELAGRAPSAHNRQPWRWVVLRSAEARTGLAEAMAADFERDLRSDATDEAEIARLLARSRARIGGAPLLILPCLTMVDMDEYPDPERQRREWQMAVQSVALAAGTLLLAAHAEGLGGCWICAPIFCIPTVREALDLPPDWEPQGLLALGYPADGGRDRERKGLDEIVIYR